MLLAFPLFQPFPVFLSQFVLNGGIIEEVIDLLLDFKAILQLPGERKVKE